MAGMRSRWRMRCKAGRRKSEKFPHDFFTIKKSPSHYRRPIKCPTCGSEEVVSYEHLYLKKEKNRERCFCGPVPHPHRSGSHRLCDSHPLAGIPLTEDEERQAMEVGSNSRRTSVR